MSPALQETIDEVRLLFHALVRAGESLHAGESVTMGMRAVLEYLLENGATTVPAMARARGVTRQHIQSLVNALRTLGYVEQTRNPEHQRSHLISLTASGLGTIERMRRREGEALAGVRKKLKREELRQAAQTLRTLRSTIPSSAARE